ncbi:MAG: cytochrome-c peroxidase [Deltaproteobacteria bacterium]|nr:cytochrome-c peroxidase [Deltaproteobacteria bacterium]
MRRLSAAAVLGCAACLGAPSPLELTVPAQFPPMVIPEDNPTTVEGVALGRRLYYDKRLSPDASRACADCHLQSQSFSSTNATGVLPHVNLAWAESFLWNGSTEGTLEDAMHMEVEEFFGTDVALLKEPDLEALFRAAFGDDEPTTDRAALALAQWQRTLTSGDSRDDRYVGGELSALTASEIRGRDLFYSERGECFHCHATRLFSDNQFHNNGLDAEVAGAGRAAVTGRSLDDGCYKTPTLRNVAQTAPYMHDDRFATLEEVIAFYSDGLVASPSVDPLMQNVHDGGPHYTAEEQTDLVAYLRALTDDEFLSNEALASPIAGE